MLATLPFAQSVAFALPQTGKDNKKAEQNKWRKDREAALQEKMEIQSKAQKYTHTKRNLDIRCASPILGTAFFTGGIHVSLQQKEGSCMPRNRS